MKKVADKEVKQDEVQPTKVTYNIEDVNSLLDYLGGRPFGEVAGFIGVLKSKGELS